MTVPAQDDSSLTIDYLFRVADRSDDRPHFVKGIIDLLTGREPESERTGPLVAPGPEADRGLDLLVRSDVEMNHIESAVVSQGRRCLAGANT